MWAAISAGLYFSAALTSVTGSIVGGSALLTKVYFPRLVLPLATVAVGLVEVVLQLFVLAGLMVWYQYVPGLSVLLLPLFVFIAALTALAFGIWLTALNVKFRDVGMAIPFFVQIWMYLCPIVYPITLVPERFRMLYAINPMVGVIEGFRWSLLGKEAPDFGAMMISGIAIVGIMLFALYQFSKQEKSFADVI